MKRHFIFCIAFICAVSLSILPVPLLTGAQAASVLVYLQAQPDDGTLFFQSSDGIYAQPLEEAQLPRPEKPAPRLLFSFDKHLDALALNGSPLSTSAVLFVWNHQPALLDADNRYVWRYDGSTFVLSVETEEIGQLSMMSTSVVCDDDENILLFLQEGRLIRCDLTTGRITRLPVSNLTEMTRYRDGVIALRSAGGERELIRLPFRSDIPEVLATLPTPADGGIAVDPATEQIYAIVSGKISRLEDGGWTGILPFSLSPYWQRTFIFGNSYFYVDASGAHGVSLSLGSSDYLYVRGVLPTGQAMDTEYLLTAPALPILRQTALRFSAEDIFLDIQSDNQEVDLYLIQMSTGLRQLMEKGCLAPLDSPILTADSQGLYSFAREACTLEDTLYAYPVTLLSSGWRMKAGEDRRLPEDLFDILALHGQQRESGDTLPAVAKAYGSSWTKMDYAEYALKQHLLHGEGTPLPFADSPLADFLEQVCASDFLSDEEADTAFTNELCPGIWNVAGLSFYGSWVKEGSLILPPALRRTQSAAIPASLYVYVVNPRSRHREEAIAYLEYLSAHKDAEMHAFLYQDAAPLPFPYALTSEQETIQMMEGLRRQLRDASPDEKKDLEDAIALEEAQLNRKRSDPERWLIHPETLTVYQRDYTPRISLGLTPFAETAAINSTALYGTMKSHIREALQGSISVSECMRRIDHMVQQYELENK